MARPGVSGWESGAPANRSGLRPSAILPCWGLGRWPWLGSLSSATPGSRGNRRTPWHPPRSKCRQTTLLNALWFFSGIEEENCFCGCCSTSLPDCITLHWVHSTWCLCHNDCFTQRVKSFKSLLQSIGFKSTVEKFMRKVSKQNTIENGVKSFII